MARPKVEIDKKQFENLCGLFCTQEDIADWFGCSVDTISRWCRRTYGVGFAESIKRKCMPAKQGLRRAQLAAALKGNVSMLIWLGKQYLGQKDKTEISSDEVKPFTLAYSVQDLKKRESK